MSAPAPRYRSDIAGNVKAHIADFECSVRNQLQHGEEFLLLVEDAWAYDEYKDTLTEAEMKAAFKRALKGGAAC